MTTRHNLTDYARSNANIMNQVRNHTNDQMTHGRLLKLLKRTTIATINDHKSLATTDHLLCIC